MSGHHEATPREHFVPEPPDAFPILSAAAVVEVRKLAPEAIARWSLRDIDYVVFEPFRGGLRVRPAAIEDQVKYEQESGLGRITYSLGEFLDEFDDAPSNPAPTFDRLAQFKRDYRKLTPDQRARFRSAAKKVIAPLSASPPCEPTQPLVKGLEGHPGFFEVYVDRNIRAVYTFGPAVRHGQPHIVWCRIGDQKVVDRDTAVHAAVTDFH
jgi:hypothetical protein